AWAATIPPWAPTGRMPSVGPRSSRLVRRAAARSGSSNGTSTARTPSGSAPGAWRGGESWSDATTPSTPSARAAVRKSVARYVVVGRRSTTRTHLSWSVNGTGAYEHGRSGRTGLHDHRRGPGQDPRGARGRSRSRVARLVGHRHR